MIFNTVTVTCKAAPDKFQVEMVRICCETARIPTQLSLLGSHVPETSGSQLSAYPRTRVVAPHGSSPRNPQQPPRKKIRTLRLSTNPDDLPVSLSIVLDPPAIYAVEEWITDRNIASIVVGSEERSIL